MTETAAVIRRVAGVFLVDGEGRVLLQHRDADAPTAPNQWGLLGGGIEAGEEPEAAARREVLEESGLEVTGPLALWWHGLLPSVSVPGRISEWYVYCAPTDARQEHVVVGEGQAITFVAPATALTLDLAKSARDLVPRFLASATYRQLRGIPSPRPRLRDLGIRIGRLLTGVFNAITDVPGVLVGQRTILHDEPRVARTGVTVVVPREGAIWTDHAFAGYFSFNGCGEMTGLPWVDESGLLTSPIGITNTFSVGAVHEALIAYAGEHGHGAMHLPVVAETYDGWLNDIAAFQVRREHVYAALENASAGPVAEGNVGGGTGMICHQFKGGIGTSSRVVETESGTYTMGALVQANYGERALLRVDGVPVGREIGPEHTPLRSTQPGSAGSIIVVVATDAPLVAGQCKRLARRATVGLGRVGGVGGNGSGDIFIAFATGNHVPVESTALYDLKMLPNAQMNPLFEAVADAVEEAILNALTGAETMSGVAGHLAHALPLDELQRVMGRYQPQHGPQP